MCSPVSQQNNPQCSSKSQPGYSSSTTEKARNLFDLNGICIEKLKENIRVSHLI